MMGKYRFLYIFVVIAICVSINVVFSGEVKAAAADDDTVVQSEGGTTDTDPAATSEKSEGSGPKTRPPGWDKGEKKGFDDDTPKPKPSPSE